MKIKDLPENTNLGGIKVKTSDGKVGYWKSQWIKGVWLGKHPTEGGQIYPQFVNTLTDTLDWEITEEEVNL